jgi:hypothetical protein
MAYPFPSMSFSGFLEKAKNQFGVSERRSNTTIIGPRGPVPVVWLERQVGVQVWRVPKPDLADDQTVSPLMMDNLCRRLDLDKNDFGYRLA